MRTVPCIADIFLRLDAEIDNFVATLFAGHEITAEERKIISLPVRLDGLGITIPSMISDQRYDDSLQITKHIKDNVVNQTEHLNLDSDKIKKV